MMAAGEPDLYVYALAAHGLPQRMRILGRSLRALPLGPADAVVERRAARPAAEIDALEHQHAIVRRLAARSAALLPARFGTQTTGPRLREIAMEHATEISSALGRVRGRVQMTVRVFGRPDEAGPVEERGSGTAYLRSRRARAAYVPGEVLAIRQAMTGLDTLDMEERVETSERAPLRVTLYHLILAGDLERYRERASGLQETLAPHQVTVSGPWPAFAFSPELL